MNILYSQRFIRHYSKLPDRVKILAEEKEEIFKADPFHPFLKTHKLHGKFEVCYAFYIDYKHRIIFEFTGKNIATFMLIGNHKIYE